MAPAVIKSGSRAGTKPRVLVVDDEAEVRGIFADAVGSEFPCKLFQAGSISEALRIIKDQQIELLVTDVNLPDGDGTSLLPLLRTQHPHANSIVISGNPSVAGAIAAMRHGALDFIPKPFTASDLCARVGRALKHQAAAARNEHRIDKLRHAVRRLNDARKIVTKKVDLLCNDLISAYGELSRQLDTVRAQEAFKNFMGESKDLEQLLCHTMDFLMRQMGYCNIAIWLAGDKPTDFQLGAYMKYTLAGEQDLTDAMRGGLVKLADRQGAIRLRGDEAQEKLTPAELDFLADQDIIAQSCTYLGETLAVVVVFREDAKGFTEADVATLSTVSPLFALSLAGVVREAHTEDGPQSGGVMDDDEEERRPAKDDWWKNGEPPPY